ncbi:MAG: hypothetical protein K2M82_02890 [Lachnospiraceae bacterium]|nr:hypothetical protein [Lachnospiraceae bacterium]
MGFIFPESLACKLIDMASESKFRYGNQADEQDIFQYVYEPVYNKLRPLFLNYDEDKNADEIIDILTECKSIFLANPCKTNPAYTIYIEMLITGENSFRDKFTTHAHLPNCFKRIRNKSIAKKNKKWRTNRFYWFVHEFINDYNNLRKALGLPNLTRGQKRVVDKIADDDVKCFAHTLIGTCIFFMYFPIVCVINAIIKLYYLIVHHVPL